MIVEEEWDHVNKDDLQQVDHEVEESASCDDPVDDEHIVDV